MILSPTTQVFIAPPSGIYRVTVCRRAGAGGRSQQRQQRCATAGRSSATHAGQSRVCAPLSVSVVVRLPRQQHRESCDTLARVARFAVVTGCRVARAHYTRIRDARIQDATSTTNITSTQRYTDYGYQLNMCFCVCVCY